MGLVEKYLHARMRIFFSVASPIPLEIRKVFPREIGIATQKNLSPTNAQLFFNQSQNNQTNQLIT